MRARARVARGGGNGAQRPCVTATRRWCAPCPRWMSLCAAFSPSLPEIRASSRIPGPTTQTACWTSSRGGGQPPPRRARGRPSTRRASWWTRCASRWASTKLPATLAFELLCGARARTWEGRPQAFPPAHMTGFHPLRPHVRACAQVSSAIRRDQEQRTFVRALRRRLLLPSTAGLEQVEEALDSLLPPGPGADAEGLAAAARARWR